MTMLSYQDPFRNKPPSLFQLRHSCIPARSAPLSLFRAQTCIPRQPFLVIFHSPLTLDRVNVFKIPTMTHGDTSRHRLILTLPASSSSRSFTFRGSRRVHNRACNHRWNKKKGRFRKAHLSCSYRARIKKEGKKKKEAWRKEQIRTDPSIQGVTRRCWTPKNEGAALCLELCSLRNTIKSSLHGASLFNGWLTLIEGHARRRVLLPLGKSVTTWETHTLARDSAHKQTHVNRDAHVRFPDFWDIFDIRTALSVSNVGRREMRGECSDAWHVSGEARAPLNRTPISNEYREESPCAPRISNAVREKGYCAEPLWERYAVVIIFCYPLAPRRGCGFSTRQTRPITRRT